MTECPIDRRRHGVLAAKVFFREPRMNIAWPVHVLQYCAYRRYVADVIWMVRARPVTTEKKRLGSLITNRRQNLLRQIWTIEVAEQNRCVERFGHQGVIAHLGRLCKVEAH